MIPFSRAIEGLDIPVMLIGPDLRVAFANQIAHRLLGYPAGDLRGLPMLSLLGPHRQGELRNFEQLLEGGSARRVRSVLRQHDGRPVQVALMLSPCLDEGGRIAAVTVRVDAPEAASAAASAAAYQSRPPALVESGLPSSWPAASPARGKALPEVPDPPGGQGTAVHSVTVPPPATREARVSEPRLSQPAVAPHEALLVELGRRLRSLEQRLDALQRRLQSSEAAVDDSLRAELLQEVFEMRLLLDRTRELERELSGRWVQRAPA